MREVVIVGAGVVGVSLALQLTARPGVRVTVLDRDSDKMRGSTAYAPGFIGHYNDAPVLVELARSSTATYARIGTGFSRPGGLELATSEAGAAEIERRSRAAREAGLDSTMFLPTRLREIAPFADDTIVVAAARCTDDAVAEPAVLCAAVRSRAEAQGARFRRGEVVDIAGRHAEKIIAMADGSKLSADDVVLAGGIWGSGLAAMTGLKLPLFPVAHPYVYSATHSRHAGGPFVRWPELHVYARIQGDKLGIGSYDHSPVPVRPNALDQGAGLAWHAGFDSVITKAQRLLAPAVRFVPERRINGVFAMTPDNLPFLGAHPGIPGIWLAQAIWVTHAAGAAAQLAGALLDDAGLPGELAVDRFTGQDDAMLETAALRLYRDIYASKDVA